MVQGVSTGGQGQTREEQLHTLEWDPRATSAGQKEDPESFPWYNMGPSTLFWANALESESQTLQSINTFMLMGGVSTGNSDAAKDDTTRPCRCWGRGRSVRCVTRQIRFVEYTMRFLCVCFLWGKGKAMTRGSALRPWPLAGRTRGNPKTGLNLEWNHNIYCIISVHTVLVLSFVFPTAGHTWTKRRAN